MTNEELREEIREKLKAKKRKYTNINLLDPKYTEFDASLQAWVELLRETRLKLDLA